MPRRDEVRAERALINERLVELGVTMDAERSKDGMDPRKLAVDGLKLINDGTPRFDSRQVIFDDPPLGAFNSSNVDFQLSGRVQGLNIVVIWHDSTNNEKWVLTRSGSNPPLNHEFFFDRAVPTEIAVGNPPAPGDGLVAVFLVQR